MSTEGCKVLNTTKIGNSLSVTCQCSHLTDFVVLDANLGLPLSQSIIVSSQSTVASSQSTVASSKSTVASSRPIKASSTMQPTGLFFSNVTTAHPYLQSTITSIPSARPTANSSASLSGLSVGAISGIVIAGIILIGLVVAGAIVFARRRSSLYMSPTAATRIENGEISVTAKDQSSMSAHSKL